MSRRCRTNWGEEGLSAAERLYAWNTLEVLAMSSGNIEKPANAIPGRAHAVLQLRFVVGTRVDKVVDAVRAHLHGNGFPMVEVRAAQSFAASRTDFDSPWINWAADSIRQTTGKAPAVLPNFGGSLPNDVFSDCLGLPTIWVPHSYPGCSQHAPNEHILLPVTEEALGIMAGLFWDLGEMPTSRSSHSGQNGACGIAFVASSGRRTSKQALSPVPSRVGCGRKLHSIPARFMQASRQSSNRRRRRMKHLPMIGLALAAALCAGQAECRGAHGDIEEHQGNRRDHARLSRLLDSVLLSRRQPEADRLRHGHLLQDRRRREEGAQARQARGQAQSGDLIDPHSVDGQWHRRPRMRLDHQ